MLFTDSFIHGGTERQFIQAVRLLDRDKYEVWIGCLKRRGPFLSDIESLGIPIYEFPIRSLRQPATLRWFLKLTKFLRISKIDLLHAFDFYTNVFAVPAAKWAGVPAVVASRRELALDRSVAERAGLRLACALADSVVANSQAAARHLTGFRDSPRSGVEVIYNSVDLEEYRTTLPQADMRRALGLPNSGPLVGMVAALRREKGHANFLRAAAKIAREDSAVQFVIVGDGPERARLEDLVNELGLPSRVIFAGDRSDVPDWLNALDIVVMASEWESLPNAVLEAMAVGRPVIATRVGGMPEAIDDGRSGFLVPPGNADELARRILELVRNPALARALGKSGRALAEREFAPSRMKSALENLYARLLREHRPTARVLQIGNYPPPICGWSLHIQFLQRELAEHGADSRVLDIGPGRRIPRRDCIPVYNAFDYIAKLVSARLRKFTFQVHVNGDSVKGYTLAFVAVLLGRLTGKPSILSFHAGPSQLYFPRSRGFWFHAFRTLFLASGEIICNNDAVKRAIVRYGAGERKVHAIPAFSEQYSERIPVPLPTRLEQFLESHDPLLCTYLLFRPEFTVECLFEAFAELRREHSRAGLVLAGPQEVPPAQKDLMNRLGISSSVLLAGNLPHAQFLTLLGRSDAFIRTHLRDGVCASILESLNLGVPVVAAEDGHRPSSVVTYAPGDALDLGRALRRVLADLFAARAQIRPQEVVNNLESEVALVLACGN